MNNLYSFDYFMNILRKEKNTIGLRIKMILFFYPRLHKDYSLKNMLRYISREFKADLIDK